MAGAIDQRTGKPISELSPLELLDHLRSLTIDPASVARRNVSEQSFHRKLNDESMKGDWWGPTRRYEGGTTKHDPIPENLEWFDVTSSNVRRIAYEKDFARLWIEFHSGAIYRYYDVPESTWEDLLASDSKGMFVWYTMRNNGTDSGTFGYEQVRPGYKESSRRVRFH